MPLGTIGWVVCGVGLFIVVAICNGSCCSSGKRMHRHVDGAGNVVYVNPVEGFNGCDCGGGFVYVGGSGGDGGGGGDGGDGGGDGGGGA
jgi:hypothetical protein